jgi:hypothetical protein
LTTPRVQPAPRRSLPGRQSAPSRIEPVAPSSDWSFAQRVGFRFLVTYIVLYSGPFPIDALPFTGTVGAEVLKFWQAVVPRVGVHLLRLSRPVSLRASGSGDKLFDWVQIATMLLLAALVTVAWSLIDSRRRNYTKAFAWFQVYLRYWLGAVLLVYGFDKVVPNQFEPMNPVRLTEYFGEASPGGFAWSFLGFSVPYVVFCGLGETVAGLLLFWRRTATLGAFIGAAVMSNVFMLNMNYDIPVKQYSGHLLLMLCFLVACDHERLIDVFLRNGTAAPRPATPLFKSAGLARAGAAVAIAFVAWTVYSDLHRELGLLRTFGRLRPQPPVYGIFEVEQVVKNGVVQLPLLTDSTRWRRMATSGRTASIRFVTDSVARYTLNVDSTRHRLTFAAQRDTIKFRYAMPDSAHLVLHGRVKGDSVDVSFRRRDESSYLLVSRGFHLVNETPNFR